MGTDQRSLLLRVLAFTLPFLAGIVCLAAWFAHRDSVPPVTNSFSFDAKLEELRKKQLGKVDVLLLGSSLTLNNVSSKAVAEVLDAQGRSFHNMSAWGLMMTDLETLCQLYVERHDPNTVVICGSTEDFDSRSGLDLQPRPVTEAYLNGAWKGWYFLRAPLVSRIREWEQNIGVNSLQDSMYTSLKYDEHGGVALHMTPTSVSPKRLNQPFHSSAKHEADQYAALERMSAWLRERSIRLVMVRTPVRKTYAASPGASTAFAAHAQRCSAILKADGHTFIDRMDLPMQDEWFVDVNHLGAEGAYVFTKSWAAEAFR